METGKKEVFAAVVLAAGRGKRMESSVHKQYLLLHEKPVLYYALKAFEESPVREIVLVVGKGEIEYCQKEIVEKYGFQKISHIIEGGAERYHSVYCGLKAIKGADYVLIHDGARPFLEEEIIKRNIQAVREYQACVAGMPVKDTIKVSDEEEFAAAQAVVKPSTMAAIKRAIANVKKFHEEQMPKSWLTNREFGSMLGQQLFDLA